VTATKCRARPFCQTVLNAFMSHQIRVEVSADHVATVEFERGPRNHFDVALIAGLADTFERLDADADARAIVLCSSGRHFCAGADLPGALSGSQPTIAGSTGSLYGEATRLFATRTPIVAAVQGAAVGGGLGLALTADFRVAGPSTRFIANFSRLGLHQGFGITVTLPAAVGIQRAQELLYTGREVPGSEAVSIGLCDRLAGDVQLRSAAHAFAAEIASSAPLAVQSIRQSLRGDLADRVRAATINEQAEQIRLAGTRDFAEGVSATAERRRPRFTGS
jgi:2-(1,2-epoxy-1,2-dihydrophenyl)acetyl-CoA isomerase